MSRTYRKRTNKFNRHPKTFAERRAALAAKDDGLKVRPKRNAKNLPTSYDDLPIAANSEIVDISQKLLDKRAEGEQW